MPVHLPKMVLPAHPLLVPPALTAQVPMSSLLQVANVVLAVHPLLVPPDLTAHVPIDAPMQVAEVVLPTQLLFMPPALTAQVPVVAVVTATRATNTQRVAFICQACTNSESGRATRRRRTTPGFAIVETGGTTAPRDESRKGDATGAAGGVRGGEKPSSETS